MIKSRFKPKSAFWATLLLRMYTQSSISVDAHPKYVKMQRQDAHTWNAMIAAYVKQGYAEEAFKLLIQADEEGGMKPDEATLLSIVKACYSQGKSNLGKQIHAYINKFRMKLNPILGNTLISMYIKSGSLEDAWQVFNSFSQRDEIAWTLMIAGHYKHGDAKQAFKLFQQMQQEGVKPDEVTLVTILNACASARNLEEGRRIHEYMITDGLKANIYIANALADMYARCGRLKEAQKVFEKMPQRDVVSWNTMIVGYAKNGQIEVALKLFWHMDWEGTRRNDVTFLAILDASASLGNLKLGKQLHALMIAAAIKPNSFIMNTLVDMYAKCGSIEEAQQVFDKIPKPDVAACTAMIAGYVNHGYCQDAFEIFWKMVRESTKPSKVTFVNILTACANLEQGKTVHEYMLQTRIKFNVFMGNALIGMYANFGSLELAHQLFESMLERNVVSWTALIAGYAMHGNSDMAFHLFEKMKLESIKPNEITFLIILNACAHLRNLAQGMQIHDQIITSGIMLNMSIQNALIDMYSKCGSLKCARDIFNMMLRRDAISWTALIAGYSTNGKGEEALELFWQMEQEGVHPNDITFVTILCTCANLAVLDQGRLIHGLFAIKSASQSDTFIGSALIDMYAKCGGIDDARQVFDNVLSPDIPLWNVMIAGYAQHGCVREALQLVEEMQRQRLKLDHITFIAVLFACNHAGSVHEGQFYFNSMGEDHAVQPKMEHYACMVDILARAGSLETAEAFIKEMPCEPSAAVWVGLLVACMTNGNVELAKRSIEHILGLEPQNTPSLILLSNIYAASGMWDDRAQTL